MAFSFKPKTEEELQEEQLCGEGIFPFTVLESGEVVSKSTKNAGKIMIKLKLNIHGDDGFDYHVYDYVADWFMAHKLRHLFYTIGRGAAYETGQIDATNNALAGLTGWADVGIQKAKDTFPAKNIIKDYKPQDEAENPKATTPAPKEQKSAPQSPAAPKLENNSGDDDVPF